MATKNDITGDTIISKQPSESYRDGWDRIFGKKKQEPNINEEQPVKSPDAPSDLNTDTSP